MTLAVSHRSDIMVLSRLDMVSRIACHEAGTFQLSYPYLALRYHNISEEQKKCSLCS